MKNHFLARLAKNVLVNIVIWRVMNWSILVRNLTHVHSRPVNLHPLFLKIEHPAFWKMGHPAFCKKQAEKNRVILYSKREETRLLLLFLNYNDLGFLHSVFFSKSRVSDFQKAGCPIFKNSGCRLTGRLCSLYSPSIFCESVMIFNKRNPSFCWHIIYSRYNPFCWDIQF